MSPTAVDELDEAHTALHQAPGHQTIIGEGVFAGFGDIDAMDVLWLTGHVHQLGDTGLHAVGQLAGINAGFDFGIVDSALVGFVKRAHQIERATAGARVHAVRIGQEQNRLAAAPELDTLIEGWQETSAPAAFTTVWPALGGE